MDEDEKPTVVEGDAGTAVLGGENEEAKAAAEEIAEVAEAPGEDRHDGTLGGRPQRPEGVATRPRDMLTQKALGREHDGDSSDS